MRLLPLLLLVGCAVPATTPTPPPKGYAVEIGVLLAPCPIAKANSKTTEEAVRVANARLAALVQCNKDKARVLELLK